VPCRPRGRYLLCLAALAALLVPAPAPAQGLPPAPGTAGHSALSLRELVDQQNRLIERLTHQLKELRRLDELEEELPAAAESTPSASPRSPPPLDEDAVRKVVTEYLKDGKTHPGYPAVAPAPPAADPDGSVVGSALGMAARWDHGLWFETPDRAFRVHPYGWFHWDVVGTSAPDRVEFGPGGMGPFVSAVNMRRARLGAEGTFWEVVGFNLLFDFVNSADADLLATTPPEPGRVVNTIVPVVAWLQLSQLPLLGSARGGIIRPPFGIEYAQSSRFQEFMERSYPYDAFFENGNGTFYPGFLATNTFADQRATWAAALYWNSRNIFGGNVGDGEWAQMARLTWLPYTTDDGRDLLHLGASAASGDLDDDIARWRARPLLRNGNAVLFNTVAIGRVRGDHEWLANAEAALNRGPFSLQGEATAGWITGVTRVTDSYSARFPLQRNLPVSRRTYFGQGAYVQALYFLTGETRPYVRSQGVFGRVIPYRNFFSVWGEEGLCSGPGAWQVGVRYSWLDLTDAGILGGELHDITLALNWYLNPNAKIQWDYSYGTRTAPTAPTNGDFQAVGMRLAFDF